MGHNVTRQKQRGEFMKMGLPQLAGWHFVIRSQSCPDDRYLPVDVLIERHGPQHTLGHIVPQLRCQFRTCPQAPAGVKLHYSLDANAVSVVLIGPGAF